MPLCSVAPPAFTHKQSLSETAAAYQHLPSDAAWPFGISYFSGRQTETEPPLLHLGKTVSVWGEDNSCIRVPHIKNLKKKGNTAVARSPKSTKQMEMMGNHWVENKCLRVDNPEDTNS